MVWHHTAGKAFEGSVLAYAGGEGVTLFFAISGFLITSLLLRERDRQGRIDLRAFYLRRAFCIFPLYYLTLAAYALLVRRLERHSEAGQAFFRDRPYFASYTSNWFVDVGERTIFYFAWSLAAEEQFYPVWPVLLMLLARTRRALAFVAAASVGLVLLHLASTWLGRGADSSIWLQRAPAAIALGTLGALACHDARSYSSVAAWLGVRGATTVFAAATVACAAVPGVPDVLTHMAAALLAVSVCVSEASVLTRFLAWRPLVYVGSISYGIYLLHMLGFNVVKKLLDAFGPGPTWWLGFVATTGFTIVVAATQPSIRGVALSGLRPTLGTVGRAGWPAVRPSRHVRCFRLLPFETSSRGPAPLRQTVRHELAPRVALRCLRGCIHLPLWRPGTGRWTTPPHGTCASCGWMQVIP